MWLDLETPQTGDRVSSPICFRGRTNVVPSNPVVIVRLYDQDRNLLGETTTTLQGEMGYAGTFRGALTQSEYTGPAILVAESEIGATIVAYITIRP
jgi:hypothetical protein